jgi:hypothetical protein
MYDYLMSGKNEVGPLKFKMKNNTLNLSSLCTFMEQSLVQNTVENINPRKNETQFPQRFY